MPELQKTYEAILNKKVDRRNFRKKMLNLDLVEDTNTSDRFEGNKPAKVYKFKNAFTDDFIKSMKTAHVGWTALAGAAILGLAGYLFAPKGEKV